MKIGLPLSASSGDDKYHPENIYKYKISENELKKICSSFEGIKEFTEVLKDCIYDDDFDNKNLLKFIKDKKFGILYGEWDTIKIIVYCITDNNWYMFYTDDESNSWKISKISYNSILNISKK